MRRWRPASWRLLVLTLLAAGALVPQATAGTDGKDKKIDPAVEAMAEAAPSPDTDLHVIVLGSDPADAAEGAEAPAKGKE